MRRCDACSPISVPTRRQFPVLVLIVISFPSLLQFVHLLFHEIDQDGSGTIDKGEFRMMLRKLNLTYR